MKEVKLKRFAGQFKDIPFEQYIQSPIGLVPKAGGQQTRLIFHLSHDFAEDRKSVNFHIPHHICSVKYKDLDDAIRKSLKLIAQAPTGQAIIWYGKTDMKSAFRILPG